MMGKGEAYVTFDGTGSSDPDGTIESYEWDLGDGTSDSGPSLTHGYSSAGKYSVTLTVTDDCGNTAQSTVDVEVTGPTPPAPGSEQGSVEDGGTGGQAAPAITGTMGFCHLVQYSETLSGIGWHYGVTLADLARVNNVSMEYYVLAGQGLFIPTAEIVAGPNLYQVQEGDTLQDIALECGLSLAVLAQANGLAADAELTPGQNIAVPLWSW
jgi:LysM repeat protein